MVDEFVVDCCRDGEWMSEWTVVEFDRIGLLEPGFIGVAAMSSSSSISSLFEAPSSIS